jgi:excisionase family DNA binding protein
VRAGVQNGAASGPAEAEIIAIIAARCGAWSAPDLAKLLGCSVKHIYALAKSGRMPHLRIDGMIRFDPGATAAWLRERFIAA